MKSFLICLLVAFMIFSVTACKKAVAFDEFPGQPKPAAMAEVAASKAVAFFPNMSLDGVAVWLPELDEVAAGALTDVAVLYEFVNLSVMAATTITDTNIIDSEENPGAMVGPALGVNIPNLVKKLGGTWISDSIASSVGVSYLYDMGDNKFRLGVYGSLVRINLDPVMKKLGLL